jgi:phosphatidylinositol glycan class B
MEKNLAAAIDWKLFFYRCFGISLLLHIITAWFSIGYQYQDEHSQIMEFAAYKLGLAPAKKLSWEFKDQIRQAIQPFMAYVLYRGLQLIHLADPFTCSFLLRLFSSLLGWASILWLTWECCQHIVSEYWKKFVILLSCFIWFLPYVQAHFSAESLSGSFMFIAVAALMAFIRKGKTNRQLYLPLLCGACLGLAFVVRYQVAFMLFGVGLWCIFIGKLSFKNILLMVLPAIAMIGLGVIIDYWFYGKWLSTAYNYYYVNLAEDKVSTFGTTPPYFYFYIYYLNLIPPFSIIIMGIVVYAWYKYPKHILTWVCVPFFLGHSLIGHKEIRFLFPMAEAIPILLVLPFQFVDVKKFKKKLTIFPVKILWVLNLIVLAIFCVKPANAAFGLYNYIYHHVDDKQTLVLADSDPYTITGAWVNFHKPLNVTSAGYGHLSLLQDTLSAYRQPSVLVAISNTAQADSFEKAYPKAQLLYKSLPKCLDYMTFKKEDMQQVWRLYSWPY